MAEQLPKVWVGGSNTAPCYRSVKVKGQWVEHKVACYELRPPTIAVSEDGNGFLSALRWTTWTTTRAVADGLRFVRCWGYYPPGQRDPRCVGATKRAGGYNVPVTVTLSKPFSTPQGLVFMALTEKGRPGYWCLGPACPGHRPA